MNSKHTKAFICMSYCLILPIKKTFKKVRKLLLYQILAYATHGEI